MHFFIYAYPCTRTLSLCIAIHLVILRSSCNIMGIIISGRSNIHVLISLNVAHSAIVSTDSSLQGHVLGPVAMFVCNAINHIDQNSCSLFNVFKRLWTSLKSVISVINLQIKINTIFFLNKTLAVYTIDYL